MLTLSFKSNYIKTGQNKAPRHPHCFMFLCFSIDGEYVPVEGDEVTYKVCRVPPKNLKVQAVEVKITHLNPGTKHETWSGQIISS